MDITEIQRIIKDFYKPRRNRQILRKVQSSKSKPKQNRKDEWTNYKY